MTTTAGYNTDGGSTLANYSGYSFVMGQSWDTATIAAAKAAGAKPIIYQDLTSVRTDDQNKFFASGLSYEYVNANHPEWFLLDANGQRIAENGFPNQLMVDWGNIKYQREWGITVACRARSLGVNWIFADNALTYHLAYTDNPIPRYPTDTATQNATLAFMKYLTTFFNQYGINIIYNVGYTSMFDTSSTSSLYLNWLPYSNGLCNEFPQYIGYPNDVADQKAKTIALGKTSFFGHTNGLDPLFDVVH